MKTLDEMGEYSQSEVHKSAYWTEWATNANKIKNAYFQNDKTNFYSISPEFICLLFQNYFQGINLMIMNSSIYGYDDSIDPINRDFSVLNYNFIPSTLLDFERNQAFFMFGKENDVYLQNISIKK